MALSLARYFTMENTKELMHCHCGTNNRAPRWTFADHCKPELKPGAREESASPASLATPAMNARDTKKVYIWRHGYISEAMIKPCFLHLYVSMFYFVLVL